MKIKKIVAGSTVFIFIVGTAVSLSGEYITKPTVQVADASLEIIQKPHLAAAPQWLEDYVVGVVAAEMPVSFNIEALKAQAVASRTYAYRAYCANNLVNINNIKQAYLDSDTLKSRWGDNFEKYYSYIKQAADETKGEIIVYNNEAILAVFSAAGGGLTESSANSWGSDLPYLQSVQSNEDENCPVFYGKKEISLNKLASVLGTSTLSSSNFYVINRSDAGYVLTLKAADKEISGNDFKNILGLKSSNFYMEFQGDNVIITTHGYGHGVGMSQYGAENMANEGYDYIEILKHYYSNTEIAKLQEG